MKISNILLVLSLIPLNINAMSDSQSSADITALTELEAELEAELEEFQPSANINTLTELEEFHKLSDEEAKKKLALDKTYQKSLPIIEANNQFSIDLYKKLTSTAENLFFSPYSLSSSFAMVHDGAVGKTAKEIQSVFHLPSNKTTIGEGYRAVNQHLNENNENFQLNVANALWGQKGYPIDKNFILNAQKYYSAKVSSLDIKNENEQSRVIVNDWIATKTNNTIKDFINNLPPETLMLLSNAIYFKAKWASEFLPQLTKERKFTLSSLQVSKAMMMNTIDQYKFYETDTFKIVEIPYFNSGEYGYDGDTRGLSLLAILPKGNNIKALEAQLSLDNLNQWQDKMKYAKVDLSFPKFKFQGNYNLRDKLKDMGMKIALSKKADYSLIASDNLLTISKILQKTFIEVDEKGTEASATTLIYTATSAGGEYTEPKIFNANHPFIFVIKEVKFGQILFMGKLSQPNL